MEIKYITGDMDLFSNSDLSLVADKIEKKGYCLHVNQWANDKYQISIGGLGIHNQPEKTISDFCNLAETFNKEEKILWDECSKRIIDIAFESGKEPISITYPLSSTTLNRICKLGISVAITIYPIGTYSTEKAE